MCKTNFPALALTSMPFRILLPEFSTSAEKASDLHHHGSMTVSPSAFHCIFSKVPHSKGLLASGLRDPALRYCWYYSPPGAVPAPVWAHRM